MNRGRVRLGLSRPHCVTTNDAVEAPDHPQLVKQLNCERLALVRDNAQPDTSFGKRIERLQQTGKGLSMRIDIGGVIGD